tara:strand:- start:318 stop:602 length:285 start_codon:yes stop_codon:yes gene_type:complete
MAKKTKIDIIIEELQNASKMHLRQSEELASHAKDMNKKSPLKQSGKGCADTSEGCIRKGQEGYYILNNKKGGTWRDGFDSRSAAVDQLKAIHSK